MESVIECDGQQWDKSDVQALLLHVGAVSKLAKRLGKSVTYMKNWTTRNHVMIPKEYARHRARYAPKEFMAHVLSFKDVRTAAKSMNISLKTLRSILQEFCGVAAHRATPDPTLAQSALSQYGSLALSARAMDCSILELKKAVPEWKSLKDPTKAGRYAGSIGRIGEIYVAEQFPGIVWASGLDVNNPDYDFIHHYYMRVDVKTTVVEPNGTWTWEIDPKKKGTDTWFLVGLDAERKPLGLLPVVRSSDEDEEEGSVGGVYCEQRWGLTKQSMTQEGCVRITLKPEPGKEDFLWADTDDQAVLT